MAETDLVLEGGGAKGPALVGAIAALAGARDPYAFHRVAASSAGAIVGGLLASGLEVSQIKAIMDGLDFAKFKDRAGLLAQVPLLGPAAGLLFHQGMYAGEYLHRWITDVLAAQGVHTWADLRHDDPGSALPLRQRYKLVVIVSDVSRGIMLRLPWDYEKLLGVDPDTASVADAIRASASIPFFFRPWNMPTDPAVTGQDHIVCVDGGLLSNYPLSIFDRNDGKLPRWPTLGVKLSGRNALRERNWNPDNNSFELAKSLLLTLLGAQDRGYISDPQASSRTIFVDTSNHRATDFKLTQRDKDAMYAKGLASGREFLTRWDWEKWKSGDYR